MREGRSIPRPQATLPESAAAADNGVTAAAEQATPTEPAPPAAPPRDPLQDYRDWRLELTSVADAATRAYPRQLATMHDKLDGLWVSDGDVDRVMEVLQPLPSDDAAALVRALGHDHRTRLVDNINPPHRRNFRREVLASYAALTTDELARFDQDLFDGLSPAALTPPEHFLAIVALLGLPSTARRALATTFQTLLSGRPPDTAEALRALRDRRLPLNARADAEQRIGNDPEFNRRLQALQRKLRDPSAADALSALDDLRQLRPGADAGTPDQFAVITERLEQTGSIDRLLKKTPGRDQLTPERREVFVAVIRQRPVDANLRLVGALLDTGFFTFHWWVSQAEATLAWEIVRNLPLDARDRFLRRDDGEWLQRLEANLPAGVRDDPEFAGLAVRRDEHGALVDQGQLQAQQLRGGGSQLVTSILQTLDRGGAARAFDQLLAIRPPELREAVVARLDTLRRIEPLIDGLPDSVLFSEDHRLELQQLAGARDAQHLIIHIRRLLRTDLLDWAVNSREAFIAYLMIRALPQGDRDQLGQLEFIVGELSTSMRQSLGLHILDARSASDQLEAVRTRLRDERLWVAEKAPELRSLVTLAVSLGDRRWVFEQSRARRAFEITALRPMVDRFQLYDERPPQRTTYVDDRVQEAGFWEDYGAFRILKRIGSAIAIVVSEGFAGRLYVNLARGEAGTRSLPIGEVTQALGGDPSGVRVSDTRTVATNEATLRYSWSQGTLDLDIPRLELDSIGMVGSDYSFHTGRVSARGIRAHADFEREAQPPRAASATLNVAEVDMDDVVAGTTTALNAAAHVHMGGLGIGDAADLEPPGTAENTHLPVPVLGAVIEIAKIMLRRGAGGEGRGGATQVSFELANFAVEGLSLGGGQQVHSLAIAGVRVTWAGTRVRYLRALIAALQQRPQDARTQTQLADARRELAALEPQERRLTALIAKSRSQTLTADEQAELQQLQASGQGGIVVDTGAITLRGLSGSVSAAELTVDHIRGQGQSDAFSSGLFTDEAILRRFAQQGPGLPQPLSGSLELELGTISARDIAIERAIPTTTALQEERNRLLDDRPGLEHQDALRARVDARLARLHDLIEDRLRLDRLEALTNATPEQVRERRDLHTALARTFGVTIESAHAERRHAQRERRGLRRWRERGPDAGVGELDIRGVRSDAYAADRISGEGLSLEAGAVIPGLGDPTGGAHARADHLRIEGISAEGLGGTVDSIDVRGLAGTVTRLPNGWRLTGLHLDTLALSGVDWGTATQHIRATTPVTVSGIDASLDLIDNRMELHRIDIAAIEVTAGGQGLIYEDFKAGRRATVLAGALRGVWAEGLTLGANGLERREGATLSGAGIRQFDGVRFAAALGASLSGSGTVSAPRCSARTRSACGCSTTASPASTSRTSCSPTPR